MILHSFPESGALAVVGFVILLGNLEPLMKGFVIDAVNLVAIAFHKDFLHSICLEWRKPRGQLPDGSTKLTAVLMEISPFRIAAIPAQRAADIIQLTASYCELPVINRAVLAAWRLIHVRDYCIDRFQNLGRAYVRFSRKNMRFFTLF